MYIVIHAFFGPSRYRLKYSSLEDVENIDAIKHPIIKACLKASGLEAGTEIASLADIPAGTGLGSSSSFTVGLLNALYAHKAKTLPKQQLAELACEIEINQVGSPIGKQDQFAAAYGGINVFRFHRDNSVACEPLILADEIIEALQSQLRLYYLGGARNSNELLRQQSADTDRPRKEALIAEIIDMITLLRKSLETGDVDAVGPLLHQAWLRKRAISDGITSPEIDEAYDYALANGATGGKLLGAGGNGFILLCHPDHDHLSSKLRLSSIPLEIDFAGSTVTRFD